MIALIDSDIICYSVGFATEGKDEQEVKDYVDLFIHSVLQETDSDSYECWLSDSRENNFRHQLVESYKANRTQPKPTNYKIIKEYILDAHNGLIAHELEADDMLAIRHKEMPLDSVICTLDKDLDQVEGKHYRWALYRKRLNEETGLEEPYVFKPSMLYEVDGESAIKFFWKQMLIGDVSDNIKGINKIGTKTADKIINPLETEAECRETVYKLYEKDGRLNDFETNYLLLKIPKEN